MTDRDFKTDLIIAVQGFCLSSTFVASQQKLNVQVQFRERSRVSEVSQNLNALLKNATACCWPI